MRSPETPWLVKTGGAIAGAAITLTGCGGENSNNPQSPELTATDSPYTQTVEPTVTETPFAVETSSPSSVPEAQTKTPVVPTETSTPSATPTERVQNVPCEILPEVICATAEPIQFKSATGENLLMLGFKNIPEGTEVNSVSDGTLNPLRFDYGGSSSVWDGMGAIIFDSTGTKTTRFIGDFSVSRPDEMTGVSAGGTAAIMNGSEIDNFDYDLIVQFTKKNEAGVDVDDIELYETLFPGITSKEPVKKLEFKAGEVVLAPNIHK